MWNMGWCIRFAAGCILQVLLQRSIRVRGDLYYILLTRDPARQQAVCSSRSELTFIWSTTDQSKTQESTVNKKKKKLALEKLTTPQLLLKHRNYNARKQINKACLMKCRGNAVFHSCHTTYPYLSKKPLEKQWQLSLQTNASFSTVIRP